MILVSMSKELSLAIYWLSDAFSIGHQKLPASLLFFLLAVASDKAGVLSNAKQAHLKASSTQKGVVL